MGEGDATLTDFDPFGGSALADPYPQFAHFVEHQPVFWSPELGYWVVSRYADARRVLREHETFSAANALAPITPPCPAAARALADGGFRSIPTLTNVDPPAHTRTRRIAQMAFSPRRVAAMEPFVRDVVRRFVDEHGGDGHAEIVGGADVGAPGPRALRDPRGARRRCRGRQAGRHEPAAVHVRTSRAGRPGRHRHRHGRVLALLRGARRRPSGHAAVRLHLGPRAHPRPGRRPADPTGGRHDPVRAPARRPRDDHEPPRQRAPPAARGTGPVVGCRR